jgi:hypothetical protein
MKIINNLKLVGLTTLAALAATLLFQTQVTRANDHGRDKRNAEVTFTKWITGDPGLPGLLETLEGVVGGDIGDGTFAGEVLKETVVGDQDEVVAFYHFTGSKHSFSAIVHLDYDLTAGEGSVLGVVTDGWLKGHAVEGKMMTIDSFEGHSPAFAATIEIKK